MSDYTPSIDEIRVDWVDMRAELEPKGSTTRYEVVAPKLAASFDRAIAKVRAEAKAEALREAAEAFDYEAWNTTYAALKEDPDANIDRVGVPVEWLRARADKLVTE